jgi:hypothetical protein
LCFAKNLTQDIDFLRQSINILFQEDKSSKIAAFAISFAIKLTL